MKVNRETLLGNLNRVAPGLSPKGFITQSSCFVFQHGYVSTFNDEVCCRAKTEYPDSISGAVRAKELLATLQTITDDEIELLAKDKEFVIQVGRKKIGITMESDIRLPVDQVQPPKKWADLPDLEEFANVVKQACNATGKDDEQFVTVALHLHPEYIESSDRKQFYRANMKLPISRDFLVRAKSIKPIVGMDLVRIGETEDWLHLRNKSIVYSCRRHLESYPDLSSFVNDFQGEKIALPKGVVEAAKLGSVFATSEDKKVQVHVRIESNCMTVTGRGQAGYSEVNLDLNYSGNPISFYVSSELLEYLIENFSSCEINSERLVVRGENWIYQVGLQTDVKEPSEVPPEEVPEESDTNEESEDFEGAY